MFLVFKLCFQAIFIFLFFYPSFTLVFQTFSVIILYFDERSLTPLVRGHVSVKTEPATRDRLIQENINVHNLKAAVIAKMCQTLSALRYFRIQIWFHSSGVKP